MLSFVGQVASANSVDWYRFLAALIAHQSVPTLLVVGESVHDVLPHVPIPQLLMVPAVVSVG